MATAKKSKGKVADAMKSTAKPVAKAVPQERFNNAVEASSIAETGRLNVTTLARDLLAALVRMGPITPICPVRCRVLTAPPFVEHAPDCEYATLVSRATDAL